jgi:uncharacterized protein (DUF2147 family)
MPRFFMTLILCAAAALAADSRPTPVGTWRVIGDESGEAEALISISERDGRYEGTIVVVFPRPGIDPDAVCDLCTGKRRNQPVRGLTILTGMRQDKDEYTGGEILDPETGDIYRCKMWLSDDNRKLHVRGFIGISLIGRTQTWLREQ